MLSTIYVTGISSAAELRYTLDNNVIFLAHIVKLHMWSRVESGDFIWHPVLDSSLVEPAVYRLKSHYVLRKSSM